MREASSVVTVFIERSLCSVYRGVYKGGICGANPLIGLFLKFYKIVCLVLGRYKEKKWL